MQGTAAHHEVLRRARFVVAVEEARDVAHPRPRRQHIAVADPHAEAVSHLGADVPAVIVRDRALGSAIVQHQPVRLVAGAATLHREVEELRRPFEPAVGASEHVVGIDVLRVEIDREPPRTAADKGAEQPVRPHPAVDAKGAAPG